MVSAKALSFFFNGVAHTITYLPLRKQMFIFFLSISFLLEGGTFRVYTSSYAYIHKSKFSCFKVIFATVLTYFKKPYADIL